MAEAVVDRNPMSRFFCHKCSIEIEGLLPDYTCPLCACGFIEELERGGNDNGSGTDSSSEDLNATDSNDSQPYEMNLDILEMLLTLSNSGQRQGATSRNYSSASRRPYNSTRRFRINSVQGRQRSVPMIENFIQDFLLNLSGAGLGHSVNQDGQPPVLFLGNPGDYVWGRDGLDAIVTQLLNQLDGTGPPPLPRKQIDEIPTTNVTQSQVDSKLQCSVCWEDFKLDEPVRQLPCQHVYHAPCIVPWLELHGTCPICRHTLGDQNSAESNHNNVSRSLAAAFFRAASETQNASRTAPLGPSSSSSSSSSSSPTENNTSNNLWSDI